jgi:nucleotide-binding universal stress UspA family protein
MDEITRARPRIVVGVDGSEAALDAVRYAAHEALQRGAELVIAHATPGIVRVGTGVTAGPTSAECRAAGLRVLERARRAASEVAGATGTVSHVATALLDGPPAAMLVGEAEDAEMLVLGGGRRPERFRTGSVLSQVLETSEVPVVIVPEGWAGEREGLWSSRPGRRSVAERTRSF